MRRAFRLACLGTGVVAPNPLVGCVIVRDGQVIGSGHHVYHNIDHAETLALRQAAEGAQGADMYVTLEPCCHHGRTPPCVEAIVAAGIRRVFVGMADPNPEMSGKGLSSLAERGIETVLCENTHPFQKLNRAFIRWISQGRPWIVVKTALTLDGKIAPLSGQSQWITGERARRMGQYLRFRCDAIMIGSGTALMDDPLLTCRYKRPKPEPLVRILLDPMLKVPRSAGLFQTEQAPTWAVCLPEAESEKKQALSEKGVRVIEISGTNGRISMPLLMSVLGENMISSVLVEGGSGLITSLAQTGMVDECFLFYGTSFLGNDAVPFLGGMDGLELSGSPRLSNTTLTRIDPDFLVHGFWSWD